MKFHCFDPPDQSVYCYAPCKEGVCILVVVELIHGLTGCWLHWGGTGIYANLTLFEADHYIKVNPILLEPFLSKM